MTALRLTPPEHHPRIVTVRCDETKDLQRCRETYAATHARCPFCGGTSIDPLTVDCESCSHSWPCPSAIEDADIALRNWAVGDYSFQAAAEIVIRSRLRAKLVPRYLEWSHFEFVAAPDFEGFARDLADGDAYLCTSELTLFRLAANIAYGPADGGENLDLRGLFSLDDANVAAVCDAVLPALRRRAPLAVAR